MIAVQERPTLIVQTGDLAQAFDRFAAGEGETFRDQRASVDHVQVRAREWPVTVICRSETRYDRVLTPGLRAIGWTAAEFHGKGSGRRMIDLVRPVRIIARLPHTSLLRAAHADEIPTFACLADLMQWPRLAEAGSKSGLKEILRNLQLRRYLRGANVVAVANHGRVATRSLVDVLGTSPAKTLMREHERIPMDLPETDADRRKGLLYVGTLTEAKGIGDLISALGQLGTDAPDVDVAGAGPMTQTLKTMVQDLNLSDRVTFCGLLTNDLIRERMRSARAVVVPSRHSYAEGMPNVIQEALSTRTPLIVSDHPAFKGPLMDGSVALVFRAGDANDLAQTIRRFDADPTLCLTFAAGAEEAASRLHCGHLTSLLMDRFIADDRDRTGWVRQLSLEGEAAIWL